MIAEQRQPVEDSVVPCEGRCGVRLFPTPEADGMLRERGLVAPRLGDWAPFHTPERCGALRVLREVVEHNNPDTMVDISPGYMTETVDVHVSREHRGLWRSVTRALPDRNLIHSPHASSYAALEANIIAQKMWAATGRACHSADTEETP